ncbi:MAG: histidine phosphatase family protein [Microthrixaceae bacterium]
MSEPDGAAMPLDLFLVRHGHSEGNRALDAAKKQDLSLMTEEFRRRNASDYRLTDRGDAQARAAGRWIREWQARHGVAAFDRLYCSPFVRTRETAGLLGLDGAQWQLESLLRERDFGLWAGRDRADVARCFPLSSEQKKRDRFLWRPEGGENTPDLDMRVREVLASLAREMAGRRVVCVTHEDVMWAFRYRLEKPTVQKWLEDHDDDAHDIPNCGILHYTRRTVSGGVADKFARVRLVDPQAPSEAEWIPINRPRFTNEQLLAEVEEHYPRLWEASD